MKQRKRTGLYVLLPFIVVTTFISCKIPQSVKEGDNGQRVELSGQPKLIPTASPIELPGLSSTFYKNIPYGNSNLTVFDLFLPRTDQASPLVLFIHGGGFIGGQKENTYEGKSSREMIKQFLSNGIAFASINYTLLTPGNDKGVIECLNDCKRALQFIRFNSGVLHIDKERIVLMGGSAGAGASLWIAFNDDMADKHNPDPVMRESTRVKGVVAMNTQSTYNLLDWSNLVFSEYKKEGLVQDKIEAYVDRARILNFYGLKDGADLHASSVRKYAEKVDMLALMSSDDPPIYVSNRNIKYELPKTSGAVIHHPLHAKALMDQARKKGIQGRFDIPPMNIDATEGETREDFVIRLLGKKNAR